MKTTSRAPHRPMVPEGHRAKVKGPNGRLTFLVIAVIIFVFASVFDFFHKARAAKADFQAKKEWVKGIFNSMEILANNIDKLDSTIKDGKPRPADSTLVQKIQQQEKVLNLQLDSAKKEGVL